MSTFNPAWLTHLDFVGWLAPAPDNKNAALCTKCQKIFSLSNMGRRALTSHMGSMKHKQCTSSKTSVGIAAYFAENPSAASSTTTGAESQNQDHSIQSEMPDGEHGVKDISNPPAPNLAKFLQSKEVKKAEILWALKSVMSHYSYTSNEHMSDLFKAMFWDSNIAQNYSCSKTKMSYLITFGIAPAFEENLVKTIRDCDAYVIMFDEAFNGVLQLDQMDLAVRFWHTDQISNRYLGSQFIDHTRAVDLVQAFKEGVAKLDMAKLLQVGMDGPNVNIKMMKLMKEDRQQIHPGIPELLEIGVCNLHVLHGALKTGLKKTGWEIDKLLRSLHWLFHDSFGRRREYTEMTNSTVFPLNFCATRWTEDERVAQRAIEIWPSITQYVKETLKKKKAEIPTCASFTHTKETVLNDKLIISKLEFFVFVARMLQPFLVKYQAEDPRIVYLARDVSLLLIDIVGLFVKPAVLENCNGYKLATLDVGKPENHLETKKISIGNGTKRALESAGVSALQQLDFRQQCVGLLCALVEKIQERCPLKYSFVRSLQDLDPHAMTDHTNAMQASFSKIAEKFTSARIRTSAQCDQAEIEFRRLLREKAGDLRQFDEETQRLDQFYYDLLHGNKDYQEVWEIVKRVLLLSHGQAKVERGFSVNEDMLEPNIKKHTVVALRMVYDTMMSLGIQVHEFKVTDQMLNSCGRARAKYDLYLMDQRKAQSQQAAKRKSSEQEELFIQAKKKLKSLEEQAESCEKESAKKAKDALKKENLNLLAQSVALKEKADALRKNDIAKQKKTVEDLKSTLSC